MAIADASEFATTYSSPEVTGWCNILSILLVIGHAVRNAMRAGVDVGMRPRAGHIPSASVEGARWSKRASVSVAKSSC